MAAYALAHYVATSSITPISTIQGKQVITFRRESFQLLY